MRKCDYSFNVCIKIVLRIEFGLYLGYCFIFIVVVL